MGNAIYMGASNLITLLGMQPPNTFLKLLRAAGDTTLRYARYACYYGRGASVYLLMRIVGVDWWRAVLAHYTAGETPLDLLGRCPAVLPYTAMPVPLSG